MRPIRFYNPKNKALIIKRHYPITLRFSKVSKTIFRNTTTATNLFGKITGRVPKRVLMDRSSTTKNLLKHRNAHNRVQANPSLVLLKSFQQLCGHLFTLKGGSFFFSGGTNKEKHHVAYLSKWESLLLEITEKSGRKLVDCPQLPMYDRTCKRFWITYLVPPYLQGLGSSVF